MRPRAPSSAFAALLGAALLAGAPAARAADPAAPAPPGADARAQASRDFAEGRKAYAAGDFVRAGQAFDRAYDEAPHHAPLWNAARAWQRAGELPRAANLYAAYLAAAPKDAPDRNAAIAALAELQKKLARLDVVAPGFEGVTLDGAKVTGARVYVVPGTHILEGKLGDRTARVSRDVEAGAVVSVALVLPEPEPSAPAAADPAPAPPPPAPAPEPEAPPPRRGLSPWFVALGGALTAGGAGFTVWSGLDTQRQRDAFDAAPTEGNLSAGRDAQLRTNVAIGVTAGFAVATALVAAFAVDWKGAPARASAPPAVLAW